MRACKPHLRTMRPGARATSVVLATLALAACTGSVPPAREAAVRSLIDEGMIRYEPLCIEAGPFPFSSGTRRGTCDACQALHAQGFLTRVISGDATAGGVTYDLSDLGQRVYRERPDPALLALVRRRFDEQGRGDEQPDADALAKPRFCFGETRFHSIADALMPVTLGDMTVFSAKVVTEARDTSGLLFDPRTRALGLPLPERAEQGAPALYPPRVVSFQVMPDGSLDITDMRYGRWLNEP